MRNLYFYLLCPKEDWESEAQEKSFLLPTWSAELCLFFVGCWVSIVGHWCWLSVVSLGIVGYSLWRTDYECYWFLVVGVLAYWCRLLSCHLVFPLSVPTFASSTRFLKPWHRHQSVYIEVKMQKELYYLSVTRGLIFWEILVTSSSLMVEWVVFLNSCHSFKDWESKMIKNPPFGSSLFLQSRFFYKVDLPFQGLLLTLFYTRGLGIVVSHVMVALPYRFSLWFFT